ncbi:putative membrane protein (TIGR02226 family) [Mesorhizobium sp. J18]|uniref:DUF4159 domain-containing protein n=1 Tax=Mesorhizobium sp. J18 TaxID=935263 RepID=UPI001198E8CA|nr:DUF4159 domain-containing protein [Mesorhizobium sp. J18]TWG97137.1 putative membrane protein (TIGR02226 family) [Mesorhizobium sp. J18]
MSWFPIAFGAPMVLWGLIALPVIWWLLRLTPPRPQTETFPPLRILANVLKKEETPHQSPWWLTLLRLLMAALIILALAAPVFNPREKLAVSGSALALVIDNGWASAPDWERRAATAERLITDARDRGVPVLLALTAEKENADIGPFDAETALQRLNAVEPRPVPTDRPAIYQRVATALQDLPGASVAVLADGLAAEGDEQAFANLFRNAPSNIVWIEPERLSAIAVTNGQNEPNSFIVTAVRTNDDPAPRQVTAYASDDRGRRIAETILNFGPGETEAQAEMNVPFELRNDFTSVGIDGERHAGAVRMLDENSKRRRVGLISQGEADQAQPLLSPLYYIRRALGPYADLVEPSTADLSEAIPQIIERKPAVIVMADVGTLPEAARQQLVEWVRDGGTLLRFAGPRLAAAGNDEDLLPVRLRVGERSLGGTLSWTEPQAVAEFPQSGPFGDLTPPREVTVSRQILAEPSPDIVERTWASLADGTPLVTSAPRGDGTVVLFHITPEATWSNLPISGSFVEMLRRVVQLSRNQGSVETNQEENGGGLAPYRMISATGELVPPPPDARPLPASGAAEVNIDNPPGLYGSEDGVVAHNLFDPGDALAPLQRPEAPVAMAQASYAYDESRDLKGPLMAAALLLMLLDTLAVLWMGGLFTRRPRRATAAATTVIAIVAAGCVFLLASQPASAQEQQVADADAIDAISVTRIAYVITGDSSVDSVSRAGIEGLSRFLAEKTALEPGEPAGVDLAEDELSFYPLIYWPIDESAPMPSEQAIARLDAYMRQGGTVLFDTRDQYSSDFGSQGSASPTTMRLREILADLNVPPLEPVPEDHVLTKSFYIMTEFPGLYRGGPLWVEASMNAETRSDRPVRTGDGVTPIMITGNDFAGAWAVDANGEPLLPTVPADPMQRVYAYRAGVNIMMYMLTGNYKSDQVHVPVLLERLGQ